MTTGKSAASPPCRPRFPASPGEHVPLPESCLDRLQENVPHMTESLVAALRAAEPSYRDGVIPPAEPPIWIGRSFTRAVEALRVPAGELPGTLDIPRATGSRRARQGVPLPALVRAYHVGGRLLHRAIADWAAEEDMPSEHSAELLDAIWNVLEQHSIAAVNAFESARGSLPGLLGAGCLLDALLNGETSEATAAAVAKGLALPQRAGYAVIAQRSSVGSTVWDPDELPARSGGTRIVWRAHGETAIGVALLKERSPMVLRGGQLPTGTSVRAGVSGLVDGLTELSRARRQAEVAARTLVGGHGLAFFEERLPAAMLTAQPDVAVQMQARVLAPVLALDEATRDALLQTLKAWLAGGSVSEAALTLFCHRNTVLNRLRKLERLTRRSLSAPRDLIELGLALEAYELISASATSAPRLPATDAAHG